MFFDRAIWIIYLIERGLSTVEIGLAEALLDLSIILCEIPSGIVSDIYGRRISLIFSKILTTTYSIGMIFSNSFSLFSIFFIVLGISETFTSGADKAL
jgi:MFS family permease